MASGNNKAGELKRRLPLGFLGMVGIILLIERLIAGHDLDLTSIMQWDWRVTGKMAKRPGRVKGREILCFGDSLVKFGLLPKVIEKRTGEKTYNFAVHTGQAPSSYFLLRRAIRAGANPSAVILDLTPHMLMQNQRCNQLLWADLLTPEECLDLTLRMRDPEYFGAILLAEAFPSIKLRHEIRASIKAACESRTTSRRDTIIPFLRNMRRNEGAILWADSPAPLFDINEWVTVLYSSWSPDPVNLSYLDRFLQLAELKEIPVYWLLPPIHPEIQARTEASGFDRDYSKFVTKVQSRFPATKIVDARYSRFAADEFRDGIHLNRRGAVKLSALLADCLSDRNGTTASESWVKLEPGRTGADYSMLEDIEQSARNPQAQGNPLLR